MVVERRSIPPSPPPGRPAQRGIVSPRAFPRRAEKRAQMLMSVGLGVVCACPSEGGEGARGLRAPDRVSAAARRRGRVSSGTAGRFYHAHLRADWPAAEWRPGGRVASGRRRRGCCLPSTLSPRPTALSRDGGGECRRCRGATSRARVAPITARMEQLAQFVSKSFDNAAAAVAAATGVEVAAGCRAAAGGRITLSVAHLIGDHAADDGDRRMCNNSFRRIVLMPIFRCRVAKNRKSIIEIGSIDAVRAYFLLGELNDRSLNVDHDA